jgi:AcrR family transcriptional regulator
VIRQGCFEGGFLVIKVRDRQVTEEKILRASLAEFGEFGYSGARVDRIADRADVNKAMIYYYFKNKEVLYERVLKDTTTMIFNRLKEASSASDDPVEILKALLVNYMTTLDSIDRHVIKTLLRELASGGDFFRKVAMPNLIFPMIAIVESLYAEGVRQKKFKPLNPYYSFIQLVGGILFFNMIKLPVEGTNLQDKLYSGDYIESFRGNYFNIVLTGLLEKEV